MRKVTVTVPCSSANLGAGFDVLALALSLRNTVEFFETRQGIEIDVEGEGAEDIPTDTTNLVYRSAEAVFDHVGRRPEGLRIHAVNAVPPGSGMGSSAAAIVGGVVAANALIDARLSREALVRIAHGIEGHPDNVAAQILGGLTLVSAAEEELLVRRLDVPPLTVTVALPDFKLSTAEARRILPQEVALKDAIFNLGHAVFTVQALTAGDYELLRFAMNDRLHQPYRKRLIPGYDLVCAAARQAGAAALAISGAGPSIIAFAPRGHDAIANAMRRAFHESGLKSRTFVLPVDRQGVQVSVIG